MGLADVFVGAGIVAFAMAVCGACYAALATFAMGRFLRRPAAAPTQWPMVTVLKPLHGDEPELYENLSSFCAQGYAGPLQLVLGAQDPDDPALAVARRVRDEHPDMDIVLVSDSTTHGANRKIGNLINMAGHARGEIIVISDSDVRILPDALAQIVGALQEVGVGLIHCLYRGRSTASVWSKLAALDINARFAPSVVVGEAFGAHPCLGPTMALRAGLLERIGGFEHLADFLADDFELGRAVRQAGYRVASPRMLIEHVFPETSARELWVHEQRWARTVRLVQPTGYLGSIITHFTVLALIGLVLTGFAGWATALFAGLFVLRLVQVWILSRLMSSGPSRLWLVPLRDLMTFGVFISAIFGNRVEWRGARMRMARDGAIAAA